MVLSATSVQQKDGHDTSKLLLNGIEINDTVPPPPIQPGGKAENYPRGNRGVCARSDTGLVCATYVCVMGEGPVRDVVYFLATLNGISSRYFFVAADQLLVCVQKQGIIL